MKGAFLLTTLSLASAVQGCAIYKFCHCVNDDGKPNDAATSLTCTEGNLETKTEGDTSYQECHLYKRHGFLNVKVTGNDNCKWRETCQQKGATGADSSCRDKVAS
ncbi:uncharacterized protein CTRU02_202972 [Colletotrichum truncatum]|uniref:Uncharacterized protein n=1 Tax=Colletotrichum truncatum TaxID=5467 RepID=A0ACC3Z7Z5_COLTU|nr:uncharacterized protein CTRU02_13206 [Colletotrichum truncatum]KAF6783698.1 hypothetical protein CTRU02_13206 [Colletotrichum truncatum]